MTRFLSCLALLIAISPIAAAPTRYDIGRKYVSFEMAWDEHPDAAARKRALRPLKKVMAAFFTGKADDVAKLFDEARHLLESDQPVSDAVRWADSLAVTPQRRLIDPKDAELSVRLDRMYDSGGAIPSNARARIQFFAADGKPMGQAQTLDILSLPIETKLKVDTGWSGDFRLRAEFLVDDKAVAVNEGSVSLIPDWSKRIKNVSERTYPEDSHQEYHFEASLQILELLASRRTLETDYPAYKILLDVEDSGPLTDLRRGNQVWKRLNTSKGRASVRMQLPPAEDGKPRPLVVVMHGAGGSENLFFDAYGHGEAIRQCAKRGWGVVATRHEGFLGAPPVEAIVDALANSYPVDKSRVFVIGHSMGAGHVMGLAISSPDRWRGLACLGGGGSLKQAEKLKDVPFFIGVGSDDFALAGAKSLAKTLKDGGSEKVKYVEYPDIEHIMIVPVALPDVFRWFDELVK